MIKGAEVRRQRILDLADAGPCDRCGEPRVCEFADEMCTACGHVPLCVECSYRHWREARADGTFCWQAP